MPTHPHSFALTLALLLCTSATQALELGAAAPAFALPDLRAAAPQRAPLTLQMQRGKVVYVDFWASWCAPCRTSMPLLDALRTRLQSEGAAFEVVAVNVDENADDGRDFLQGTPVSYPVLSDPAGATPAAYELQGMPTGFLLDGAGTVRLIHQGFKREDIVPLEREIRTLLRESAP
jgi:thiol-disulfide isomerase/thioredoxin